MQHVFLFAFAAFAILASFVLASGKYVSAASAPTLLTPAQRKQKELPLREALWDMMYGLSRKYGFAVQMSWKDDVMSFSLTSGSAMVSSDDPAQGQNLRPREMTVEDTLLFGSGTKPFTAVEVLKLVESDVVGLDDPIGKHIDPILKVWNGSTVGELFGQQNSSKITVRFVLQMRSGIPDFDLQEFDTRLLAEGHKKHHPIEFLTEAASRPLMCTPGTCVCYSSTNYILASMLLLRHSRPAPWDWWTLDQSTLPQSVLGNVKFLDVGPLGEVGLTTQAVSNGAGWGPANGTNTTIFDQSATILGWGCCNLAGTTHDVANFFWELVAQGSVVKKDTFHLMSEFRPLDAGWGVRSLQYGTGLMVDTVDFNATDGHLPPQPHSWGSYTGHAGMIFGFLSVNGIFSGLNASVSVNINSDLQDAAWKVGCSIVETAAKILYGFEPQLNCPLSVDSKSAEMAVMV